MMKVIYINLVLLNIHLGYSDSTNFGFTSQAPLGSPYLGNTYLSCLIMVE